MKSDGSESSDAAWRWCPKSAFLRQGEASFWNPFDRSLAQVRWSFRSIREFNLPISWVTCEVTALGVSSSGGGEGLFFRTALVKALAEAWERWWMKYLLRSGVCSPMSSNGFAAGRTRDDAFKAAKMELIERTVLLRAWKGRSGFQLYSPKDWLSRLLLNSTEIKGWRYSFFLIPTGSEFFVLTLLARHSDLGSVFDSICSFELSRQVERKLTLSVLRSIWIHERTPKPAAWWEFPDNGGPEDHALFYRRPENSVAFDFLNIPKKIDVEALASDSSSIATQMIYPGDLMPAVALATHPQWEPLSWGKQSIGGVNPFPHPLA